jgi:enoyl-[acyl-carrier-protein] reductase (NADH)
MTQQPVSQPPKSHYNQPDTQEQMSQRPQTEGSGYRAAGKLQGKVALITDGDKGIRVNAVAPGPIWTPLIPATMPPEKVEQFGKSVPMKRPAQPEEIAPCYVFLASQDSAYISGQVLHPNGGDVING